MAADGMRSELRKVVVKAFREGYQSGRFGGGSRRRGVLVGLLWALNRFAETRL